VKYCFQDQHQGQEPRELDVVLKNYLLRVILEILLKSFVFLVVFNCSVHNITFFQSETTPKKVYVN